MAGAPSWYGIFHFSNDIENDIDCFKVTISRPAGNFSLLTLEGYVIRWVRKIQSFFNAFCGTNIYNMLDGILVQYVYVRKLMVIYSGFLL